MDRSVICWFQSVSETPSEFAVLIALAMSKPTATLLELAEFAHVGRRTTMRAIDRLESIGVLRVDRAKGEVSVYSFNSWSKIRCADHSQPSMFVRQYGDPSGDRASNLRCPTHAENRADMIRYGR